MRQVVSGYLRLERWIYATDPTAARSWKRREEHTRTGPTMLFANDNCDINKPSGRPMSGGGVIEGELQ